MNNDKLRQIRIGVSSFVAKKYLTRRRIGEGTFGMVFEVLLVNNPAKKYALKVEFDGGAEQKEDTLRMEVYVLKKLRSVNARHAADLLACGREKNYVYLVMTLLGFSLSEIRKRLPNETMSLSSTLIVGLQCIDALKELHLIGFVHRDVKPSNFAIGKVNTDWIYVLDFGLCREIILSEDLETKIRPPRKQCQFRGTSRYCSLNAHKRKELGRHDDLISLMYTLIEARTGTLPWKQKSRAIAEQMKKDEEAEMLAALPPMFAKIFEHLNSLDYFRTPNYSMMKRLMVDTMKENGFKADDPLDWHNIAKTPFDRCNVPETDEQKNARDKKSSLTEGDLIYVNDLQTVLDIPESFPPENSRSGSETMDSSRYTLESRRKSKKELLPEKKDSKDGKDIKEGKAAKDSKGSKESKEGKEGKKENGKEGDATNKTPKSKSKSHPSQKTGKK